jgi:hypothetical protein
MRHPLSFVFKKIIWLSHLINELGVGRPVAKLWNFFIYRRTKEALSSAVPFKAMQRFCSYQKSVVFRLVSKLWKLYVIVLSLAI